jgi:hypothetical protein
MVAGRHIIHNCDARLPAPNIQVGGWRSHERALDISITLTNEIQNYHYLGLIILSSSLMGYNPNASLENA